MKFQLRAQGAMENINQRWAAPEILEGRDYSVESDIYSMGLIFWETRNRMMAYHDVCFLFLFLVVSSFSLFFLSSSYFIFLGT